MVMKNKIGVFFSNSEKIAQIFMDLVALAGYNTLFALCHCKNKNNDQVTEDGIDLKPYKSGLHHK